MAVSDLPTLWPVPPDWKDGMRESLAWLTEIHQAPTSGSTQHRSLRIAPRRSFAFQVVGEGQERRVADALLFDQGAASWSLPIWPDVQRLPSPVAGGADAIACRTSGFDFVPGGAAALWRSVNAWEMVAIEDVGTDGLVLAEPVVRDWPAGTRLYPLRRALLDRNSDATWTDNAGRHALTFRINEVCDWAVETPPATYLGRPVLERRPDWSDDRSIEMAHVQADIDAGTGLTVRYDLAGRSFRTASQVWRVAGREEQAAVRSLLYWLRGRAEPVWVPSWQADLRVVVPLVAGDSTLTVEWAGYSRYGSQQPNRRDLRIELADGRVLYRRITGSASMGETESLLLDAPLGVDAPAQRVRLVSFLTLSTGASDEIEIHHHTDADGYAEVNTAFQAVLPDV